MAYCEGSRAKEGNTHMKSKADETIKALQLSVLKSDSGTQSRCCITEDVVADYADRMTEGDKFPPIVVFHDGTDYHLADGFHRVLAAARNGFKDVLADVRKGSRLDALWFSLGANTTNGLRRTNADKQRCVVLALQNFGGKSDRLIAEGCGVHFDTVGKWRKQLSDSDSSAPAPRTGKDGKTRSLPKPSPAREEAPEPPNEDPNDAGGDGMLAEESPIEADPSAPSEGVAKAEAAIAALAGIAPNDTQRTKGLSMVSKWIMEHLHV
jgi:transposase-like protein